MRTPSFRASSFRISFRQSTGKEGRKHADKGATETVGDEETRGQLTDHFERRTTQQNEEFCEEGAGQAFVLSYLSSSFSFLHSKIRAGFLAFLGLAASRTALLKALKEGSALRAEVLHLTQKLIDLENARAELQSEFDELQVGDNLLEQLAVGEG